LASELILLPGEAQSWFNGNMVEQERWLLVSHDNYKSSSDSFFPSILILSIYLCSRAKEEEEKFQPLTTP
jgi:hypothetical protein